ncbi:basic amino acid/polyamine antiporter (plasmid) [Enterobacter asburiae]|uniref:basic amino acid/polyamine antiporter n=1 Tax=Enterobacter asburiae TaxID=61645 RepID=UPI002932BD54|nr:amino acid permease [Enterobacter asburiae]EMA4739801.1 amino acid permease [Enterobacter asburiae]
MSSGVKRANNTQKLSLLALVAIVVSSMIGSGVDGLPQNMAANSSVGAVAIAWIICGIGMFCISRTFIILSDIRPDLNAGIYMYTQEGFGPFCAFIVAWGYWLMTIFSNVAFGIMVMDTLNYFMPGYFIGGNNPASIIGMSFLIWGFNLLVLSGMRIAGEINIIGTLAKIIPLIIFVIILSYYIDFNELTNNIWGHTPEDSKFKLGTVFSQITSPLDISLWSFIGVEGAVALSGRAKNKENIGKATLIGFIISLVICILISILPFGVLSQATLSTIPTPSTAGIMKRVVGEWGELLMNIGVLVSVLTSWLAWTMICAEIPMIAAQNGTFPKIFARTSKNGSASVSLWISSLLMQLVVFILYSSTNAWTTMLSISALTVLPAYLMSNAYLCKLCMNGEYKTRKDKGLLTSVVTSIIGLFFCFFMFYASDIKYLVMVPPLLTLGIPLFLWARVEHGAQNKILRGKEIKLFILLIIIDFLIAFYFSKT